MSRRLSLRKLLANPFEQWWVPALVLFLAFSWQQRYQIKAWLFPQEDSYYSDVLENRWDRTTAFPSGDSGGNFSQIGPDYGLSFLIEQWGWLLPLVGSILFLYPGLGFALNRSGHWSRKWFPKSLPGFLIAHSTLTILLLLIVLMAVESVRISYVVTDWSRFKVAIPSAKLVWLRMFVRAFSSYFSVLILAEALRLVVYYRRLKAFHQEGVA